MSPSARDTPMMRHFLQIKSQHPDAIVLYRMGDFYELFLEDAEVAAPLLDLTLTSRDKGKVDPVPMCGFPVHSADGYVKRLAEHGLRVAICEQVEDPREAGGKRLVRREVVEVVTPGLVGDPEGLEGAREVAIVALVPELADIASADGTPLGQVVSVGIAALDATTGDFRATAISGAAAAGQAQAQDTDPSWPDLVWEELERIAPREVLIPTPIADGVRARLSAALPHVALTPLSPESFDPASVPEGAFGIAELGLGADARAAAGLLTYLVENQPFALEQAPRLRSYALADTMVLDGATRTHLELFQNGIDSGRDGTLIEQLDCSSTPLGARKLVRWLGYPLVDPAAIDQRLDAVEMLAARDRFRGSLRETLRGVRDLERLLAKAARPGAVPRDLGMLRASLQALPEIGRRFDDELRSRLTSTEGGSLGLASEAELEAPAASVPRLLATPEPLPQLQRLLEEGLIDDPPVIPRGSRGANETGYVRPGFRPELDALRESASKGREWIASLEAKERERTGIPTLKVRFHPVHGYSLEVTKAQLDRVPGHYERKQTLANVERFTTEELSEMQGKVMGANERAAELERSLFESLRQQVVAESLAIRAAAERVAVIDALAALADVARRKSWVRPIVNRGERLEIRGGRHPVVEDVLQRSAADGFVPNDTDLDPSKEQILLLTGPNMSGKSTYLRQVALIALLAQTGSFVPADSARIGVVDRIFTRIGASDRLAKGESTFMVEMRETADILRQASRRSLLILDEIGRGTSTFDGLSIAWAVAEYLHDAPGLGARTLFATHYHELTDLARTKPRVRNAHFEAREWKEEVVFLRRLVSGGANRSYGIQVARLAGLPEAVITRSRQILKNLEDGELTAEGLPRLAGGGVAARADTPQLSLELSEATDAGAGAAATSAEREVLDALRDLEPDRTTPIDALLLLQQLRRQLTAESANTVPSPGRETLGKSDS